MGHLLTIEGDEAFALATELAALRGESLDRVVTAALRATLDAERRRATMIAGKIDRIRKVTAQMRAEMTDESFDAASLYDDQTGLPI
jgi:hypothetical protein